MFLLVVTDKTAYFDTLQSIWYVFAYERSLLRSDASVKWLAGVATCEGGFVCLCGCVCACVGACEGVCGGVCVGVCVCVCVCVCV